MSENKPAQQPIKLIVGTPAYNSVVYTDYLHSVLSYSNVNGLIATIFTLGNESLITRARNKIFTAFINSDADYLLFLDADIYFDIKNLEKLILAKKDIIGAPVRLKTMSNIVLNCQIPEDTKDVICEVPKIGTGVMLITKQVALEIAEYCKEAGDFYYDSPSHSRGDKVKLSQNKIYDVFKVGQIDGEYPAGEYLSEDYYFCKLAQKLGYTVYAHTGCVTAHNGTLQLIYQQ